MYQFVVRRIGHAHFCYSLCSFQREIQFGLIQDWQAIFGVLLKKAREFDPFDKEIAFYYPFLSIGYYLHRFHLRN